MPDEELFCLIGFIGVFIGLIVGSWLLGVRPYLRKNGKAAVTAAGWELSMWVDYFRARELAKELGETPRCTKIFFFSHIPLIACIVIIVFFPFSCSNLP